MFHLTIISISLPKKFVELIDKYKDAYGYMSRSEVVRDALKSFFIQEEVKRAKKVLAVILLLYSTDLKGINERILDLLHKNRDLIISFNHMHAEQFCVEQITCRGDFEKVSDLIRLLRRIKGVLFVREAIIPL